MKTLLGSDSLKMAYPKINENFQSIVDQFAGLGENSIVYNDDGTIGQIITPDGSITNTYEEGRLVKVVEVVNGATHTTNLIYNDDGLLLSSVKS